MLPLLFLAAALWVYLRFFFTPPDWLAQTDGVLQTFFTPAVFGGGVPLSVFMTPGIAIARMFGLDPPPEHVVYLSEFSELSISRAAYVGGLGFTLLALFLFSWFFWVRSLRLSYCILGRAFGFYNPAHFSFFTHLWLPWRIVFRYIWLPIAHWWEEMFFIGKKATARFAGPVESASLLYKEGDIFLGRYRGFGLPLFQPVGMNGNRHLVMIAGTGSGKTTQLITMLGLHIGNAFVIDPKGQIAKVIANRMGQGAPGVIGQGKKVCILDPTAMVKEHPSAKWNPFDEIEAAANRARAGGRRNPDDAVVEFTQKIVDGLIIRRGKENPFWPGAARDFLFGLILFVYTREPRENRTLGRVYELLTVGLPKEPDEPENITGFDVLVYEMLESKEYGGVIATSAAGIRAAKGETGGSVLITMREQLQWLKRPALRTCCESSDFTLEELKTGNLVLFLCAKASEIGGETAGWFRLLSSLAFAVFEDIEGGLQNPCLFVLDEFPQLGKIDAVERAAPLMRSMGVRLLCIAQDTKQIEDAGYSNWESFIGNSEACWFMATKHDATLLHLEKKLGRQTIMQKLDGPPWWFPFSRRLSRHAPVEREVMTAEQIRRFLGRGNVIVIRDQRALALKPDPYFKALPVCFYEPDSDHKERPLRAFLRSLLVGIHAKAEELEEPGKQKIEALSAFVGRRIDAYIETATHPLLHILLLLGSVGLLVAMKWSFKETGWIDWTLSHVFHAAFALVGGISALAFAALLPYYSFSTASAIVAGRETKRHFDRSSTIFFGVIFLLALGTWTLFRSLNGAEWNQGDLDLSRLTFQFVLTALFMLFLLGAGCALSLVGTGFIPPMLYGALVVLLLPFAWLWQIFTKPAQKVAQSKAKASGL